MSPDVTNPDPNPVLPEPVSAEWWVRVAEIRSHAPTIVILGTAGAGILGAVAVIWGAVVAVIAINGLPWEAITVIYAAIAGALLRLWRERKKLANIITVRLGSFLRWTQSLTS